MPRALCNCIHFCQVFIRTCRDDLVRSLSRGYQSASGEKTKDFLFDLLARATEFAQSSPLVTVCNDGYVYMRGWKEWPDGLLVEKRYLSHEDFVLSCQDAKAYSELSVNYPFVVEGKGGEIKKDQHDKRSIFKVNGTTVAFEICLDHRRGRLRQVRRDDAETGMAAVDLHLVVSCGMQLRPPSVVARRGGVVFNCDGQYSESDDDAAHEQSIFTGTKNGKGHTQMAIVESEATDAEDAVLGRPPVEVAAVPFETTGGKLLSVADLEAYGGGEIHVYSKCELPA